MEYVREPKRSKRSRKRANPVLRFEERKGMEYIREPDRSKKSISKPVPQQDGEFQDQQGMEYI